MVGIFYGSAGNRTPVSNDATQIVYKLIRPKVDEAVKAAEGMRGSVPESSHTDASSEKTASLLHMYNTRDRAM
jgi:hypothetical protein